MMKIMHNFKILRIQKFCGCVSLWRLYHFDFRGSTIRKISVTDSWRSQFWVWWLLKVERKCQRIMVIKFLHMLQRPNNSTSLFWSLTFLASVYIYTEVIPDCSHLLSTENSVVTNTIAVNWTIVNGCRSSSYCYRLILLPTV